MKPAYVEYSSKGMVHGYDQSPREVGSYAYVLDLFLEAVSAYRGAGKLAILDIGAGTGIL
jgi:hypothetical protein